MSRAPIISDEQSYVLGASFNVLTLENQYRSHVVQNFKNFLKVDNLFNMLTCWCPEKLLDLVKDAVNAQRTVHTELEAALQKKINQLEYDKDQMDKLIFHCKNVCSSNVFISD